MRGNHAMLFKCGRLNILAFKQGQSKWQAWAKQSNVKKGRGLAPESKSPSYWSFSWAPTHQMSKLRINWFHHLSALSSLQRIIESSDKSFLLMLSIAWNKAPLYPDSSFGLRLLPKRSDHRLVFASLRAPCDDQISGACSWSVLSHEPSWTPILLVHHFTSFYHDSATGAGYLWSPSNPRPAIVSGRLWRNECTRHNLPSASVKGQAEATPDKCNLYQFVVFILQISTEYLQRIPTDI